MLDQGFATDVEKIISMWPKIQQQRAPARRCSRRRRCPTGAEDDHQASLRAGARSVVNEQGRARHGVMSVQVSQKIDALSRLLRRQRASELNQTIVFHRTKHGAKKLVRDLLRMGHTAASFAGQFSRRMRGDRALDSFRANRTECWSPPTSRPEASTS